MTIETNTFEKVVNLSPTHMLDLIETVGTAALVNLPLRRSKENKIAVALIMLNCANSMLEQCNCRILTIITNPEWKDSALYDTMTKEEHNE